MNKKLLIILILIVLIAIAVVLNQKKASAPVAEPEASTVPGVKPVATDKLVEVTKDMQDKIIEESYLNILVQIQAFDMLNVNYEPLLEAAMRLAASLGLVKTETEGIYLEYVPKDIVHEIIYELSGVRVKDPIIIDDFYYLYDAEKDYYYVVPIGANWMEIKKIKSITYSKSDAYIIKCECVLGNEDYGIETSFPNMEVMIKYKPSNKYIKYQLISINPGISELNIDD